MDAMLSFTTMGTPDLDHVGAIRLALDLGFQGVDIRCADHLGEVRPDAREGELHGVARDFRAAGLRIPSVLCYHRVTSALDDWPGAYAEHVAAHLRIGAQLGADAIRVFGVHPADGDTSAALAAGTAEALADALAREPDVGIVIQNHLGAGTALDVAEVVRRVDDPRLGLVFSPDHCFLHEPDAVEAVARHVLPFTREVYVADARRDGEGGNRWVFPGEGDVPLRATIAQLDAGGFAGFYAFKWEKIWHADLPDARVAMPRFRAFMGSL